jgi:hypothetical protein
MRGIILAWMGLMGLAAAGGSYLLLRAFPRAFVESGPAIDWPWRNAASRAARTRGGLLLAAAVVSVLIAVSGIASLLF